MPNRIDRPATPVRTPRVDDAARDEAGGTDAAGDAGSPAPATPAPDVPSAPDDRVSDFVDRSTRLTNTPTPPRYENRTVAGRSVFDVRIDERGGGAGLTRDVANDSGRTGDVSGRVDVDSGGVRTSGRADVRREDGDRARHTVGDATVTIAPDGRTSGRAAGTHTDTRTVGDNRVTDRMGGEVSHDRGTTRYSGTVGRESDGPAGRRSDDVRVDGRVTPGGTEHTVRGDHRRVAGGTDLHVTEDLTVRTDGQGTHLDGGASVDRTVTGEDGTTRRDAGHIRGTTGPQGDFSVDVGGERDRTGPDGSSRVSGGVTVTDDDVRVRGAGERTVTRGDDTHTVRGDGTVTVGRDGGVTANGTLAGSSDIVRDDGTRVSRSGTLSGSTSGAGDVNIDATATDTVTTEDGSRTRRGGAHVDVAGDNTTVTVEGGFEDRRTADGTTTVVRGDATGTVRTDANGTRVSGEVSGSRDVRGPDGSGRDHGEVRGSTDGNGDFTVTVSGGTERRTDAGEHNATGTVTVTDEGGHGNASYTDRRTTDDGGRTDRRVEVEGRVDARGTSGTISGEHRATDASGDVRTVGGELRGSTHDGTHTGGATVYVEDNDAESGRRVRVETRGDVTVDGGEVRGSGAVEGEVSVTDDDESRRYRGIARSDGGRPALGVRVETESNDRRSRTNVEANADLRELRGSVIVERRRTGPEGERTDVNAAVDVHTEGLDGRVEVPRTHDDGSTTRYSATGNVTRSGVEGGIDGARRVGTTETEGHLTGGVSGGRVTAGGRFSVTEAGRVTRSLHTSLETGGGEHHGFVAGSNEWLTRYGRIGVALSGHFGRTDRVQDLGAVAERGGAHRLLLESGTQIEGAAGAGITVGLVGGRVAGRTGKFTHMSYVTHRDPAEAARLAAGPAKPAMPNIADPVALAEGDVVQLYRAGDMGLSADLAAAGVTFSGRVAVRGAFRFIVERLGGHKVRITASPEKINTVGVGAQVLIAEGALDVSKAKAFTQTFELDLSTAAGIAAYQKALEGDLPDIDIQRALSSGRGALDLVDEVNRTMPAGVSAVAFAHTAADTLTARVGVSWAFFGSSIDRSDTRSTTTRVEDGRMVSDRSTRRDYERRTWFSGVERSGCFASVRHESTPGPGDEMRTEFGGIEFGAHFSDDKTLGPELEKLVEHVGDLFGFGWSGDGLRGYGERRTIEFALALDAAALTALSQRQLDGLEDAARAVGIPARGARELYALLKSNTRPAERADKLQSFVAAHGLEGLAVLVRAFPHLKLDVRAETAAYNTAHTNGAAVAAAHAGPIDPADATGYASRFAAVTTALREVTLYLAMAERDPLLSDAIRTDLVDRLVAARDALHKSIDLSAMSDADRATLRHGLGQFAQHEMDLKAMAHINSYDDPHRTGPR